MGGPRKDIFSPVVSNGKKPQAVTEKVNHRKPLRYIHIKSTVISSVSDLYPFFQTLNGRGWKALHFNLPLTGLPKKSERSK